MNNNLATMCNELVRTWF